MEIKRDFNLRKIAGEYILMPKDTSDKGYNGLISLNEVEALVWKNLERCENEEEILSNKDRINGCKESLRLLEKEFEDNLLSSKVNT